MPPTDHRPEGTDTASAAVSRPGYSKTVFLLALGLFVTLIIIHILPSIPPWITELFLALLAAVTVHLLDRVWLYRDRELGIMQQNRYLLEHIPQVVQVEFNSLSDKIDRISECPRDVRSVYSVRPNIRDFVSNAIKYVDIVHTNFTNLLYLRPEISRLADAGVRVRLMLLDPRSSFFEYRYREVGKESPDQFRLEVAYSLKEILNFVTEHNRNSKTQIELKVSKIATTCFLYRADQRVLAAFLLKIGRSWQTIHLEFECHPGSAAFQLIEHIDVVFRDTEVEIPTEGELLSSIASASKRAQADSGV